MIFKNIYNFFTKQKAFFILLIVSITISTLILNFSYGLYQNYNIIKTNTKINDSNELKYLGIGINYYDEEHYLTQKKLKEVFSNSIFDGMHFSVRFNIKDFYEKQLEMQKISDEINKKSEEELLKNMTPEEQIEYYKIFDEIKKKQKEAEEKYQKDLEENKINNPSNRTRPNINRPSTIEASFVNKNGLLVRGNVDMWLNSNDVNIRLSSGRPYSEKEYINGEKVVMLLNDSGNDEFSLVKNYVVDNHIIIQGESYEVVGYSGILYGNMIPFTSVSSETEVTNHFEIWADPNGKKIFTNQQYQKIKSVLTAGLGDLITMPEPEFPDTENYYFYNTIIIISILISVVSALIIALLYNYILIRRWKSLTIFRLCGCTRMKIIGMYLAECLVISVPIFLLSTVAYDRFLLPLLAKRYENMTGAYSIKLYALIFGIYFVSSIIVLLLMIFKTIPRKAISIKGAGL
ncbi:hypothetical protein FACS1894132_02900 [Clostridia bacterium]|nr:hypothetical protein FACS1894132_02900 [Clostridia bacterium]